MPDENGKLFITAVEPDLIAKHWDFFSYYLLQALPEYSSEHDGRSGNLLSALMAQRAKLYTVHLEGKGIQSIFMLGRSTDPITGDIYLVLIAMVSVVEMSQEVLEKAQGFMVEETRRLGCRKLVTFSKLESVKRVAMALGASSCYMLTLEV